MPGAPRWRDHVQIHPSAALFPPMPPDGLAALGASIEAGGGKPDQPVTLFKPKKGPALLLDGVNRLDAIELAGLSVVSARGALLVTHSTIEEHEGFDPLSFVIAMNLT